MSKKEKRISVNALEKALGNYENTAIVSWNGLNIQIRKRLSLQEMMAFTEEIVNACFTENDAYLPEVMNFAIQRGVLQKYTNLRLPDSIEKQYEIIRSSGICDFLLHYIDREQLDDITEAAKEKVHMFCEAHTSAVRERLDAAVSSIIQLVDTLEETFGGVTQDDIQSILHSIGNDGIDLKKILDAYAKRDSSLTESQDHADSP